MGRPPRRSPLLPYATLFRSKGDAPSGSAANIALPGQPFREEDGALRSEEHTSELQSRQYLVCRLLLETKNTKTTGPARPSTPSMRSTRPTWSGAYHCWFAAP